MDNNNGWFLVCSRFECILYFCQLCVLPYIFLSIAHLIGFTHSFSFFLTLWILFHIYFVGWTWYSICTNTANEKERRRKNRRWIRRRQGICMSFVFLVQSTVNGALPYRFEYIIKTRKKNWQNLMKSDEINEIRSEIIIIDCACVLFPPWLSSISLFGSMCVSAKEMKMLQYCIWSKEKESPVFVHCIFLLCFFINIWKR